MLDYDWTQVTQLQGWVDVKTWEQWTRCDRDHGSGPSSYCGDVCGGSVQHISAGAMDALAEQYRKFLRDDDTEGAKTFLSQHNCYAKAVWKTPYYQSASVFLSETIPRLLKLAGGVKGVDDARIVFFFDN